MVRVPDRVLVDVRVSVPAPVLVRELLVPEIWLDSVPLMPEPTSTVPPPDPSETRLS